MEEEDERMMSLRSRRKKSSVGIICCFTGQQQHHQRGASFDAVACRSPGWFKSSKEVPEMKGKCRSFISRIGRHRRHASAEFTYDPLSYSLNFNHDVDDDSHAAMSFSARFSAMSSPRRTPHAFDHHSPTYTSPDRWKLQEEEEEEEGRGFEPLPTTRGRRRRHKSGLSSPSPAAATREEPVRISSNREILVQLC